MATLLVTGATGFVAGHVLAQAKADHTVHALSRAPAPLKHPNLHWHTLDGELVDASVNIVRRLQPACVIHCAAIADIDRCKREPDVARRVNTDWPVAFADTCNHIGARMVFVSTDNVFDGKRGMYTETDPPTPINEYGRTKVAAEKLIAAACPDHVIARTSLVVGRGLIRPGNAFLERMEAKWGRGEATGVPDNEIRTPVDVVTLARALIELATNDFRGVIHLSGNDNLDRCTMARRIADALGYHAALVEPFDPTHLPDRDARPRNAGLNNTLARTTLLTPMRGLEEGLSLALQ